MSKWCNVCYRNELSEEWKSCDDSCPVFGKNVDELAKIVIKENQKPNKKKPLDYNEFRCTICPTCQQIVIDDRYCRRCGQALDWSVEDAENINETV